MNETRQNDHECDGDTAAAAKRRQETKHTSYDGKVLAKTVTSLPDVPQ